MLLIPCPWCGPRDQSEFTHGGDASRVMPPLDASASQADWQAYVHDRPNPCGPHREFWYHAQGCERWLRVERDTATHAVNATMDAGNGQ